jgi:hypothetical protein
VLVDGINLGEKKHQAQSVKGPLVALLKKSMLIHQSVAIFNAASQG